MLAWLLFIPLRTIVVVLSLFRRDRRQVKLCLEAGKGGWEIIEYQELYRSASEFVGPGGLVKLVVDRNSPYLSQVARVIRINRLTHYGYSPRTGAQTWFCGLYHAFGVLFLMTYYRVTPIVFLTDLPVRLWRAQSAVVTALSGIVVTLMPPSLTQPIFPHSRMIGPCLMPFSRKTLLILNETLANNDKLGKRRCRTPIFIGSLYEPRTSKLNSIRDSLATRGIDFDIRGRIIGEPRKSDDEYWDQLLSATIVVTTADQIDLPSSDWKWIPHFIYRYTETLACGALLVAPIIQGVERYFVSGEHYVGFSNVEDAVEKINYYYHHPKQLEKIAIAGKRRAEALIETNSFWAGIDLALRNHSIT
jgi:hypothetical protein